jgi:hypothetical protein
MFLYKLKKLFKESKLDILIGTFQLSFVFSLLSIAVILFLSIDEFNKSEKRQIAAFCVFLTLVKLSVIAFLDFYLNYNVILLIILGYIISFFIFVIPAFIFTMIFEYDDLRLGVDEIREAKINSVVRKLF